MAMKYSIIVGGDVEASFDTLTEAKEAARRRAHVLTAYEGRRVSVHVRDSDDHLCGIAEGVITTNWASVRG
jgi:hypothetical protein